MSNSKILLSLAFYFITQFAVGQKGIKAYVKSKAIAVLSIEPNNADFSDLEAIGLAIGDARILMMGDQDHEDAPAFMAKARIIKYLHEKKGFNVVAFENSFFDTNYNWELVKAGKLNLDSFVKRNISISWRSCGSSPLFNDYLPISLKSSHPLEIAGIDNVIATPYVLPLLDSLLKALQLPIIQSPMYANEMLPMLNNWYQYTNDSTKADQVITYYQLIKMQLLEKLSKDDVWITTIDNLIAQNQQYKNWNKDIAKSRNIRDSQMARNLRWLAQVKYPTEKIILWAHNYHVSKNSGDYKKGHFLNKVVTMGSLFTADTAFREKTYIIGFTSYKGSAGRSFEKKYVVQEPKQNSFENWINDKYNFAFVNFKDYNRLNPFVNDNFFMKGSIGAPFHSNKKAHWTKIFDGVFYIKETYPLKDIYPCQ